MTQEILFLVTKMWMSRNTLNEYGFKVFFMESDSAETMSRFMRVEDAKISGYRNNIIYILAPLFRAGL